MFSNLWTEISLLRTNYPILSPAILVFVGLQIYYRIVVVKPVELHCKKNSLYHVSLNKSIWYQIKFFNSLFKAADLLFSFTFQKFLKKNLPILSENYLPTFWCFEARMQTVLASFLRRTLPNISYRREVIIFKSNDIYSVYLK